MTESYETFLKTFRAMLEAVWLRNFQLSDPIDDLREALQSYDIEDMHASAAEERALERSTAPRSKALSPRDRLHMKYAGTKPGIDEKAVSERMLRRKPQPHEASLPEDDLSTLAQIAGPKAWGSACHLVKEALRDAHEFRSVGPTQAQIRILHAAALALYSDLTEKAICEASDMSEKTLRQWLKLLDQYEGMKYKHEAEMRQRRKDSMRRHVLAQGLNYGENGKN